MPHGELRIDAEALHLDGDAAARPLKRMVVGDVLPEVEDAPGIGSHPASEQLEECALAGAVGSDDAAQLAGGERQADAVDRVHAAEALLEVDGLQEDGRHQVASRWARKPRRRRQSASIWTVEVITPSGMASITTISKPPSTMKAYSPWIAKSCDSQTRATVEIAVAVRLLRPPTATQMTGRMLLVTPKAAGVMKLPQET